MQSRSRIRALARGRFNFAPVLCAVMVTGAAAGAALRSGAEKLKNAQVVVTEYTLHPGESLPVDGRYPAVTVYFEGSSVGFTPPGGHPAVSPVRRGDVTFSPAQAGTIRNTGSGDLDFVRTEFLTGGKDETWGAAGLAPNYKVLIENRFARVYDIKIPAGTNEPQHTHKARVVVCLSGAILKHLMPDGRQEPSTLKTGEIVWRPGATHIGENLGKTDLWVIAIEPK
ncbi:MAG: cupin domain-containing protein [Bryobacteraceae bacterium]